MNRQNVTGVQSADALNEVLDDFSRWKEFLGDQVDRAQGIGISDKQIDDIAFRLGNFLSEKVDPKNTQERLLKQMWDVSSKEDQHSLARIMVNLVDRDGQPKGVNSVH